MAIDIFSTKATINLSLIAIDIKHNSNSNNFIRQVGTKCAIGHTKHIQNG